jgi:hypothetical protein
MNCAINTANVPANNQPMPKWYGLQGLIIIIIIISKQPASQGGQQIRTNNQWQQKQWCRLSGSV